MLPSMIPYKISLVEGRTIEATSLMTVAAELPVPDEVLLPVEEVFVVLLVPVPAVPVPVPVPVVPVPATALTRFFTSSRTA